MSLTLTLSLLLISSSSPVRPLRGLVLVASISRGLSIQPCVVMMMHHICPRHGQQVPRYSNLNFPSSMTSKATGAGQYGASTNGLRIIPSFAAAAQRICASASATRCVASAILWPSVASHSASTTTRRIDVITSCVPHSPTSSSHTL